MKKYFLSIFSFLFITAVNAQGKFFGGNDDGYASASSSFVVLPVTGMQLSATHCNKNICLEWTTQQEFNSNRFEIEKSTDAVSFLYKGQVTASGNSNSIRRYSSTDYDPVAGHNYYRLKQVDINGKILYSNTVVVKHKADRLILSIVNPARRELVIQLNTNGQPVSLRIFDMNGKMMFYSRQNTSRVKPDISSFAKGLYIVEVEINGRVDREKFIVTE